VHPRPTLAQSEDTRSGESFPSLRRTPLAQARIRGVGTVAPYEVSLRRALLA